MKAISLFNYIIAVIFFVSYSYQFLYIVIPFIRKRKSHEKTVLHKYAILIAARNEEVVISHLIESINQQTYPSSLIKVFVVADNCTDDTAARAMTAGAKVWERFNRQLIGKGYALDYLLERINEAYPKDTFEGYFIFDADNLLDENYITEMNKVFSDENRIITGYRNSKNYGSSWISAGFSLWFLRESQYLNRSRMLFGTSCAVSGTGFLFHHGIIEKAGGWKFYLLTEDIEFTIQNVLGGEKIAYCESAMLYDEQPVKFGQSWTQRMRWAKGSLQVFQKYGVRLLRSILGLNENSFSSFDMTMSIMPAVILTVLSSIINLCGGIYAVLTGENILTLIGSLCESAVNMYLVFFTIGCITTATEWKHICCSDVKKILYAFTFPLFMLTYIPISIAVLFKKVEWKQIHHKESKTLDDVRSAA